MRANNDGAVRPKRVSRVVCGSALPRTQENTALPAAGNVREVCARLTSAEQNDNEATENGTSLGGTNAYVTRASCGA